MACYAQLDENNIVINVIVIANENEIENGIESEENGIQFCKKLFGGNWKKTFYGKSNRKNFASIGYTYRADIDAFVPPQPYPSWTLDADANWQAPIAMPTDGQRYSWNEANQSWEVLDGA